MKTLKTMFDIRRELGATETICFGPKGGQAFACIATLPSGEKITGYGTTLEGAEDTCYYGVLITLKAERGEG